MGKASKETNIISIKESLLAFSKVLKIKLKIKLSKVVPLLKGWL
jgi:hypothetical protein